MSTANEMDAVHDPALDRTMTLRDGRTLAWREYGDAQGTPVFGFHGTPGSRIWAVNDDPVAKELGIRFITPERPGYGLSSPQKGRTLLGWADDVVQLADHLGIERFGLIGGSGGGPHLLACASALPQRITAGVLFACMAPLDAGVKVPNLAFANRLGFFVSRHITPRAPWIMRALMAPNARAARERPSALIDQLKPQLCESDRQALDDPDVRAISIVHTNEGYRNGIEGHFEDASISAADWGFDLNRIATPLHLWQGEADTLVPATMGHYLAEMLPCCTPHFLPGKGHLLDADETVWKEMLAGLKG